MEIHNFHTYREKHTGLYPWEQRLWRKNKQENNRITSTAIACSYYHHQISVMFFGIIVLKTKREYHVFKFLVSTNKNMLWLFLGAESIYQKFIPSSIWKVQTLFHSFKNSTKFVWSEIGKRDSNMFIQN